MEKKKSLLLYLCILIFGTTGIYLTFIVGNTNKYDSQTRAYKIDPNENYDSEDNIIYNPIYYFEVDGNNYECEAKGTSSYPKKNKNIVYYDSSNPTKCKTEYEKSTSKFAGIVCLIASAVIIYFGIIEKPSNKEKSNQFQGNDMENQNSFDYETVEKVTNIIEKGQMIFKKAVIIIIIIILLLLTLVDTLIIKQTIKAKDYIETTAVYEKDIIDGESSFKDCVYTFTDKQERKQNITISIPKTDEAKETIKIKYDEKNPKEYYEEGATMDKKGIIWFIVRIITIVILIILLLNEKLLNKISFSANNKG